MCDGNVGSDSVHGGLGDTTQFPAQLDMPQAIGGLARWSGKLAEVKLGLSSLIGRGARRTLTPLMERVLAVAYQDLAGHLRAQQQLTGSK